MSTVAVAQRDALLHRLEDRKWMEVPGGELVSFRVKAEDVGGAYSITEGILPPLSGPPLHIHENEDEVIQVLEGSLRFVLGREVFDAEAGAIVVIPRGARHTWRNVSDTAARAQAIFTPGGAERMFAEFVGKPLEEIGDIALRHGCRFLDTPGK